MILHKPTRDKLIGLFFLALLIVFPAACGSGYFQAQVDDRPDINLLETSLQLGKSRRADVLAALGEPMGRGAAMLPIDPKPNAETMWSYHYEEIQAENPFRHTPSESRGIFLLVFFDGDIYDGYMWYSSLPR